MKTKKRTKNSRHRGTHTHGGGAKKKGRGKGHRGGVGLSGTGKRADQKKSRVINEMGRKYFGKQKALRRKPTQKIKVLTLTDIQQNISSLLNQKIAKEIKKGEYQIDTPNHKILAGKSSDIKLKLKIHSKSASKGAIEATKKAGGEIILTKQEKKA